jgi:hypothetical protein
MQRMSGWLRVLAVSAQAALLAQGSSSCSFETDAADAELALDAHAEALSASSPNERADLALHWAPIHYMDVDPTGSHALSGRSDYITRVDFDGDWTARNNWENAGNATASFAASAYYSVVETSSHWYLVYMFFHPRDWTDFFFDTEHENDSEGVLVSVERDGSTYGVLRSAVTVAHTDFFSYTPSGSTWSSGTENVDGTLQMVSYAGSLHPVTAQEAKGHGLKARPYYDIQGGDGLVYYPSLTQAEVPSSVNDRDVKYTLIDIFAVSGLWEQRNNTNLFASFGSFAGDTGGGCGSGAIGCSTNAANAPWGWDDSNDVPGRGELATDPAKLVAEYFSIPGTLARTYTFNPYR